MSRGLKNNNPGNIRLSNIKYKGEVDSTDKAFKQFESMPWGYRAIFVLLYTYQKKYGLNTIRGMMSRYAPTNENDTEGYINFVSNSTGIGADMDVDTLSGRTMIDVVCAVSRMENGIDAVVEDVGDGWRLFMKYKP